MRKYDIFVAKIYDCALIDSFWGFPRLIDSPTSYATLEWIYLRNFQTCYSNPVQRTHRVQQEIRNVRRLFVQFFPQRKFLLSIALLPSAEEIVGGSRGNSQKFSETWFNFYQFDPIRGKNTLVRVVQRPKNSWQMNRYKRVVIDFLNPLSFPE